MFYVNLPLGAAALAGLRLTLPAPEADRAKSSPDAAGAILLARALDPIVPLDLLRTRPVAVSSAALSLTSATRSSVWG